MKKQGAAGDRFDTWATKAGVLKEGQRTTPAEGYVATQTNVNWQDRLEEQVFNKGGKGGKGGFTTKGRRGRINTHSRAVGQRGPNPFDHDSGTTIYEKMPTAAAPAAQQPDKKEESSPEQGPPPPPAATAERQSTPQEEEALARANAYTESQGDSAQAKPNSPDRLIGGLLTRADDMFAQAGTNIKRYGEEAQKRVQGIDQTSRDMARSTEKAPKPMTLGQIQDLDEKASTAALTRYDKHLKPRFYNV